MGIFHSLLQHIIDFFGISHWLKMFSSGDYSSLQTFDGILNSLYPLVPLLLTFEIIHAAFTKKFQLDHYQTPFLILVLNTTVSSFISIGLVAFCIGYFQKYSIFTSNFTWYWFIYGYIIWEFAHFIYHFLAHKVRILWCLHSTHHAPETMNLSVTFAHFFLEAPYADFIRTTICILLGVSPPVLFFIMFIDGTWGGFIHIGEHFVKDARFGFLHKIILTPSHHRVHHAKNPAYIDTNFCNLLNIWDKIFGTYKDEDLNMPIQYGITRKVNSNNIIDTYFGEIFLLAKDIRHSPGLKNKFLYLIMPPGWSHTGIHKTAKILRQAYFEDQKLNARKKY